MSSAPQGMELFSLENVEPSKLGEGIKEGSGDEEQNWKGIFFISHNIILRIYYDIHVLSIQIFIIDNSVSNKVSKVKQAEESYLSEKLGRHCVNFLPLYLQHPFAGCCSTTKRCIYVLN